MQRTSYVWHSEYVVVVEMDILLFRVLFLFFFVFFFFSSRRRHTRWNCDCSSDVCSSDLTTSERTRHTPRSSASRTTVAGPPTGDTVVLEALDRGVCRVRSEVVGSSLVAHLEVPIGEGWTRSEERRVGKGRRVTRSTEV